jgi:hypothetical protein
MGREPPVPLERVVQQVRLAGAHVVPAAIVLLAYMSAVDAVLLADNLVQLLVAAGAKQVVPLLPAYRGHSEHKTVLFHC